MTKNPTQEQAEVMAAEVAKYIERMVDDAIRQGPGHPMWELIKQARTTFGEKGVFCPIVLFESADAWGRFQEKGELPNFQEHNAFGATYIDAATADEHLDLMGIDGNRDAIKTHIANMIEWAEQPWEMPILVAVTFAYDQDDIPTIPTVFEGACLDWWDSEANTVPYPGITHGKVRSLLEEKFPNARLVMLNTRNPIQAGPNLDIWLDVCDEMQRMPMVDAESADALQHLSEKNRSKVLAIPFGNAGAEVA